MIKKHVPFTLVMSLYAFQAVAMEDLKGKSPSRSSSPTQFQIYLPSHKMEPHRSISQKDVQALHRVLKNECELRINIRNSNGRTPLEHAIESDFIEGVETLMTSGASPVVTHEQTWQNGFHVGALSGNSAMLRYLVVHTQFPDVQEKLEKACQTIVAAVDDERGNLLVSSVDKVKKLHIRHVRALVTQPDKRGVTPEQLAQKNGQLLPKLLDSTCLEETYGQDIEQHYMAELVTSVTKLLRLADNPE